MIKERNTHTCCRLCLSNSNVFINIFNTNETRPLDELIRKLTTIKITKYNILSNNICVGCHYWITRFHKFQLKVINAEKEFNRIIQEYGGSEKNVPQTVEMEVISSSDDEEFLDNMTPIRVNVQRTRNRPKIHPLDVNLDTNNDILNPDQVDVSDYSSEEEYNPHKQPTKVFSYTNNKKHRSSKRKRKCDEIVNKSISHPTVEADELMHNQVIAEETFKNEQVIPSVTEEVLPCHRSIREIKEQHPNIILPVECLNLNFSCNVVVPSFQKLMREAYLNISYSSNKEVLKSSDTFHSSNNEEVVLKSSETQLIPPSNTETEPQKQSAPTLSSEVKIHTLETPLLNQSDKLEDDRVELIEVVETDFDDSSSLGSVKTSRKCFVECDKCKRRYSDVSFLNFHIENCHKNISAPRLLITQLQIPKRCKGMKPTAMCLMDNETKLRVNYKRHLKLIKIPSLNSSKNKIPCPVTNNTLTFRTLSSSDTNELLKKINPDTDITLSSLISDNKINDESSSNKKCDNLENSKYNHDIHREKMLKSSALNQKDTDEINFNINIPQGLCQRYLPNRNNILASLLNNSSESLVDLTCNEELPPETVPVRVPVVNYQPNFYKEHSENVLKRKSDDVITVLAKQSKLDNNESVKTGSKNELQKQKCTSSDKDFLKYISFSTEQLESIIKKNLSKAKDLNDFDTQIINLSVTRYLREYPKHYNLLEKVVAQKNVEVKYKIGNDFTFNFEKSVNENTSDTTSTKIKTDWNKVIIIDDNIQHDTDVLINNSKFHYLPQRELSIPVLNWKKRQEYIAVVGNNRITQPETIQSVTNVNANGITELPPCSTNNNVNIHRLSQPPPYSKSDSIIVNRTNQSLCYSQSNNINVNRTNQSLSSSHSDNINVNRINQPPSSSKSDNMNVNIISQSPSFSISDNIHVHTTNQRLSGTNPRHKPFINLLKKKISHKLNPCEASRALSVLAQQNNNITPPLNIPTNLNVLQSDTEAVCEDPSVHLSRHSQNLTPLLQQQNIALSTTAIENPETCNLVSEVYNARLLNSGIVMEPHSVITQNSVEHAVGVVNLNEVQNCNSSIPINTIVNVASVPSVSNNSIVNDNRNSEVIEIIEDDIPDIPVNVITASTSYTIVNDNVCMTTTGAPPTNVEILNEQTNITDENNSCNQINEDLSLPQITSVVSLNEDYNLELSKHSSLTEISNVETQPPKNPPIRLSVLSPSRINSLVSSNMLHL